MEDSSAAERPLKRMRKGTKSCLACRRRKAKCEFETDNDRKCTQCAKHNLECIPQGVVEGGVTYHDNRSKLKDRVQQLQSLIDQLLPSNRAYARTGQDGDDPLVKAIEDILPGIQDAAAVALQSQAGASAASLHAESPANSDIPVRGSRAPLMRLLDDYVQLDVPDTNDNEALSHQQNSTIKQCSTRRQFDLRVALAEMRTALPPEAEMEHIFDYQSSWWPEWRQTIGMNWGSAECTTFRLFAGHTLASKDPCQLGVLLVGLAIATGQYSRFLLQVEKHIVNDDELAGTAHGLDCLTALGVCYLNALQPRRAWTVFRKANTLLQLNGIHLTHSKSEKQDQIFWQLMHADRWVSLMIGLPYMLPDHFLDLTVPPIEKIGPGLWVYRQFAILSGRVIDCLQGARGPSISEAMKVDEEMDAILAQLPPKYIDIEDIRACSDKSERLVRLNRAVHSHQLRCYTHIPFFLRSVHDDRYDFSRRSCINNSRRCLQAYVEIFKTDEASSSNGSVLNFTAFIAAVVLLMGSLGYGRPGQKPSTLPIPEEDWQLIDDTLQALKAGVFGIAEALCRQCYNALESLVKCTRHVGLQKTTVVTLPYFGRVYIAKTDMCPDPLPAKSSVSSSSVPPLTDRSGVTPAQQSGSSGLAGTPYTTFSGNWVDGFDMNNISLDYQGPYTFDGPLTSWNANDWAAMDGFSNLNGAQGSLQASGEDLGWLNADLLPSMSS